MTKCWALALCLFAAPGIVHAAETTTYKYDALGRLIKVTHAGGPANGVEANYELDDAGNRKNVTVTGAGDRVIVVPLNGFTVIPLPAD